MTYQSILDLDGNVLKTLHVEDPKDLTKGFTLHSQQDVESILEDAKAIGELQADERFRTGRIESRTHVARIGDDIMLRAMTERWTQADWARWLNDPDNAAYRSWKGRV